MVLVLISHYVRIHKSKEHWFEVVVADKGKLKAYECTMKNFIKGVCPKIDSTQGHKWDSHYKKQRDELFYLLDLFLHRLAKNIIVSVKVECHPEEAVVEHMPRWVAKTCMALFTSDIIGHPVRAWLTIDTLELIHSEVCKHDTAVYVECCWF